VTLLEPVAQRRQRRLWLVRHGESTWNVLGLIQGHMATPVLTHRGAEQARRCARLLAGKPVGAIASSDLRRAAQTARPIGQALNLPVSLDSRLRERSLGSAEGMPHAVVRSDQLGIAGGHVVDADAAPPGGESVRQFYARLTNCVSELVSDHPYGDLVLVCHGGVVRVVLAWLDGIAPEEMSWPDITNGMVVDRAAPAPPLVTSSSHNLNLGGEQ
jgi:2,3-bisphosphoglycerate-dependent phosphoglycerate mutase